MASPIAAATKVELDVIQPLRALFLQESHFQVRYHACHERGWTDSYLLSLDGTSVGYGSVKGRDRIAARDAVFEFFVVPPSRKHAGRLFEELLSASGAEVLECQTNDLPLSLLLFEYASDIRADTILFADYAITHHVVARAVVRRRRDDDRIFPHETEPVGDYVVTVGDEVVGTGGFLLHYNVPFADLFMEVRREWRRRGLGTLLLQEVKKACYLAGRVPAARCGIRNSASRSTLIRAGLVPCGFMLSGRIGTPR